MRTLTTILCLISAAAIFAGWKTGRSAVDEGTLLALNKKEDTVSLIDLASGTTRAKVKTGPNPNEVAVSPDGRIAAISDMGHGSQNPGWTMTFVDIDAAKVIKSVDLRPNGAPHGVTWLDKGRLIFTSHMTDSVCELNYEEGKVTRAIPTEQKGTHLVMLTPDQKKGFAVNAFSGTVTALDLTTEKIIKQIPSGDRAEGISISPDGRWVACGNVAADNVSIIDAAKHEVVHTIGNTPGPIRTFFTLDGKNLVVSCVNSGELVVIDSSNWKISRRIDLGDQKVKIQVPEGRPVPMNFAPLSSGNLLVVMVTSDAVAELDTKSWEITRLYKTGALPDGIAVSPHTKQS